MMSVDRRLFLLFGTFLFAAIITGAQAGGPIPPDPVSPPANTWWKPKPNTSWHVQLQGENVSLALADSVQIFEIDLFAHDIQNIISQLHARNVKVTCYVSIGTIEPWRPDASSFPDSVLGRSITTGSPERWLNIVNMPSDVIVALRHRLDLAKANGCDAIDADRLDASQNNPGFNITRDYQIAFNKEVAREAHNRGLAIGLRNANRLASDVADDFDFAVIEDCVTTNDCATEQPFLLQGKPVFGIEYNTDVQTNQTLRDEICSVPNDLGMDTLFAEDTLSSGNTVLCKQYDPPTTSTPAQTTPVSPSSPTATPDASPELGSGTNLTAGTTPPPPATRPGPAPVPAPGPATGPQPAPAPRPASLLGINLSLGGGPRPAPPPPGPSGPDPAPKPPAGPAADISLGIGANNNQQKPPSDKTPKPGNGNGNGNAKGVGKGAGADKGNAGGGGGKGGGGGGGGGGGKGKRKRKHR